RELFTEDCRVDLMPGAVIESGESYVAAVREMVVGAVTAHHGHMPIIVIDGPAEAHGTWALADYLEWPSDPETGERRGMKGYGHERETYRKVDGEWKIASMYLSYLRIDPLPAAPLPERVLGGPAAHLEGALAESDARTRPASARS
ncbi:MAG: nuclear transport factor 2 family protein, partial [Actinomycetota bacterium]|nr:nuclear transport factor 2 family protein [Actinomycetota bacterium]